MHNLGIECSELQPKSGRLEGGVAMDMVLTGLQGLSIPTPVADNEDLPVVLFVDDESQTIEIAAQNIASLGWRCETATCSAEAIQKMGTIAEIGIVITDVYLGNESGFRLLETLLDKFTDRPLAFIVSSGAATMDTAIRAMRGEAVDFLPKPVMIADLDRALQRAERQWREARQRQIADQVAELPGLIGRLSSIVESVEKVASFPRHSVEKPWNYEYLSEKIEKMIDARLARKRYFPGIDLSDPNWDIILDVALGQLTKTPVPVSNACLAAGVSMTTALRCVRELVAQGWLIRWTDPNDRRRDLLGISAMTLDSMRDYFEAILG